MSLDSSDIPHLLWLSMVVDARIHMQYLERQDTEIREAVHDVAKHRVVKRDGSTDDQFQTCIGAFFLSETVCTQDGDLSSLYDGRINLCGATSIESMMKRLGYEGMSFDRRHGVSRVSGYTEDAPEVGSSQMRALIAGRASTGSSFTSSDVVAMSHRSRRRGGVWDILNAMDASSD